MSKRKSQTAVDDYRAEGFIREAPRQLPRPARLGDRHRGGGPLARGDRRALRHRQGPEGRRRVRSRAARVAERPVDPPARGRRPDRPPAAVPRRPTLADGRIARMPADDEVVALLPVVQERLPTLGAIGDLVGFLWVDEVALDPAMLVPKRWDAATTARRPGGRARHDRRRRRGRRSRPTSSSRRCAPSPRPAAGRRATCSWPSGSRPPAGRPRRRCSTRSSRSVGTACWRGSIAAIEVMSAAPTA